MTTFKVSEVINGLIPKTVYYHAYHIIRQCCCYCNDKVEQMLYMAKNTAVQMQYHTLAEMVRYWYLLLYECLISLSSFVDFSKAS